MKKIMIIFTGLVLLGALAAGAVKTFVFAPRTVLDAQEILDVFYEERESLPPIPSPVDYKTVVTQLAESRFDFLSNPTWSFVQSGGTLYLSEKSTMKLELPMQLVAYEDLASGRVVLSGMSIGSKEIQTLAIVEAPAFAELDARVSLNKALMDIFWPRRIIWTAILQDESSFLSMVEQTLLAASIQTEITVPQMMTMAVPETITDFRIIQDGESISVNLPASFIESEVILYSCTNLIGGVWTPVSTNMAVSTGVLSLNSADIPDFIYETNVTSGWFDCPACATDPNADCTNQTWVVSTNQTAVGGGLIYYKTTASSTNDTDGDGISNFEEYSLGTDFDSTDSDGDLMPDPYELEQNFDPTLYADGGYDPDSDGLVNADEYLNGTDPYDSDSDDDGMLDGWEVSVDLNPLIANAAVDQDFDGLSNLQEYQLGFDPLNPDSDGDSVLDGNELSIAAHDPNSSDTTPPVITLTAPPQKILIIP